MTKTKKKKKLSDRKYSNKSNEPKKLNAFEMHVNRRKFNIVGMKSKTEKGRPGVSRSRAIKKRKATLMQEYKVKDKKNTFLDRRIGEKDSAMTQEDKIMARFTAQRAKYHSKKSLFNLGDSEELTHRGEAITEIEKYDNPRSDDEFDDEDDRDGKLDANFVGEAHFGGGIFKKVEGESKSRKDLIEQLIAESKKRKAEKQKIREETLDLTEKLDSEWKELLPLVTSTKKTDSDMDTDVKKDKKTASYDILSKQLKFEARGKPMDRLKSEEEIAKEEKEKLELLEKERLDRMLGETKDTTIKHRSADDLDDGFDLDDQSDFVLSYNEDGTPNLPDGVQLFEMNKPVANKDETDEAEETDEEEEEEEDSESEEGDEICEDVEEDKTGDCGDEKSHDEEDENMSSDSDIDNLSDLKESDDDEEEESIAKNEKEKQVKEKLIENINKKKKERDSRSENNTNTKEMKNEEEELPYTFEIPNDYDSFEKLISGSDCAKQSLIIERMIKCNHPSLKDSNREKLETLFTFLLQHLEDVSSDLSPQVDCFKVLDSIAPFLYDLAVWNPNSSGSAMLTVIKEKYQSFLNNRNIFPSLDTLIFIKLVSILFSTSDYRHVVATPTLIFMEHVLGTCRVVSSVDICLGLFMCTMVLEYCSFSKRLVPEVFNFIRGVLRLSHPKESKFPFFQPFRLEDAEKFNLVVTDKTKLYTIGKLGYRELTEEDNSDELKVKSISLCLKILSELCDLMSEKVAPILLFEPLLPLLQVENFSLCLKNDVEGVVGKIMKMKNKRMSKLVFERKRPRPLKLYEPRIEEIYSLKKHKQMGREKQERAKLQHKIKRETKGALREIRKDTSFLTKLKFKEIQKSDAERKRKVQEILSSVAQQTGEVRKLKRKKH